MSNLSLGRKPYLPYFAVLRGTGYRVYRWDSEARTGATPLLAAYPTRKEAQAEAYRLNGEWLRGQGLRGKD